MRYIEPTSDYSVTYHLEKKEQEKFIELLIENRDNFKYIPFVISLYKELNMNTEKLLRVLKSGSSIPRVSTIHKKVLMVIREAIILCNYQNYSTQRTKVSTNSMSKSQRLVQMDIKHSYIVSVLKKYNIPTN